MGFNKTDHAVRYKTNVINYSWYGFGGDLTYKMWEKVYFGASYAEGDTVMIELDTKCGVLKFYKEFDLKMKQVGREFNIIQKDDLFYRLTATIWHQNDFITLKHFV